ncbi:MAG: methyltransferase domain-containing protein [Chitinispirillaceae bacterium]|nr:methyltransferase domain-containing protein [Chitinispirillaceae bacterium]
MNQDVDNKEIYNKSWSSWEDMKIYGPASRWLRWLAREAIVGADLSDISTILDFGCGTGVTTSFIADLFPAATVTGCDISQSGITIADKHYRNDRIRFYVDDGTLMFRKKYDLICCFEVLEHLQEWKPILKKMTKCSHYLILSTPTGRMRPFEKEVGHVRNFQRGELEKVLRDCGAENKVVFNAGFPFYSPLYRDVCQLTGVGISDFTRNRYGPVQRVIALVVYMLFRYGSLRTHGDQFCGVFSMKKEKETGQG